MNYIYRDANGTYPCMVHGPEMTDGTTYLVTVFRTNNPPIQISGVTQGTGVGQFTPDVAGFRAMQALAAG